jgi:hypothetical protein
LGELHRINGEIYSPFQEIAWQHDFISIPDQKTEICFQDAAGFQNPHEQGFL